MVIVSKGDRGLVCRVMDALTVLAVILGLGMGIMFGMSFLGPADAERRTGTGDSAAVQGPATRNSAGLAGPAEREMSDVTGGNLTVSGKGTELP